MTMLIALEAAHRRQVDALDDQLQIGPAQRLFVATLGVEVEPSRLQALAPQTVTALLEVEHLQLGALAVDEHEQLATPVLEDLKSWLVENTRRVPKDSLTYKAMAYTLNQWELLTGYLADGRLRISNALAENAIRPFAIGRNYVEFVIMCTYASNLQIHGLLLAMQCGFMFSIYCWLSEKTAHNHKLSRKVSNVSDGLNRAAVVSGG